MTVAGRTRVLVVDDDEGIREYVGALLERLGLEVHAVEDGEQGLRALGETRPDLVLLDVAMPGASGLDLLRQIKGRQHDLPVVMLSGQGEAAQVVESIRSGAEDFLAKPFEPEQLEQAVSRALRAAQITCPTCHGSGRVGSREP